MSTFPEYRSWLVVEAAQGFGAATLAAKLLADLGCTVARLEERGSPSFHDGGARGDDEGDPDAPVHELISRGKHSIGIAYGEPEAAPALEALLHDAEVLVADRDGLRRLQRALRVDDLRERFPRLTVCGCTPFGLEGPLAAWTGGEEIVQAITGIMSVTGHPRSGPTRIAGAPLTHAAAMFAVTSILADVLRKRASGNLDARGGLLDVSVYDAALAFQSAALPAYWLSGTAPVPIGNRHSMAAPWNSFQCADGWAIICAGNHPTWVRLCETIGRPDLLSDPRYATQGDRVAHVDAIEAEVTAWTRERSVADVAAVLNAGTIACGSVLSLKEVIEHPQFRVRGLVAQGSGGRQSGGVFNLNREPLDVHQSPWRAGQGTRAILLERCRVRRADYEQWLAGGALFEFGEEHVQAA
ncbi:MAG: CoA transferase [Betaproteobacteria bacterium]|nr:CoA transferase [Betaproteobacteria bacterium]